MGEIQGQLLGMLEAVAAALGDELRGRLVFVGGCTTALHVTDPVTFEDVRATDDVDLIVGMAGHGAWARFQEQLAERGFSVSPEDDVICRMRLGGMKVDFMPDDPDILGFGNRWYARGIGTARQAVLPGGLAIRTLAPALFLATKLDAYLGRGNGDLLASKDMEDVLIVVDGRPELPGEVRDADPEVRAFVSSRFRALLADGQLDFFLEGNIRGPEGRSEIVRQRIAELAALGEPPDGA